MRKMISFAWYCMGSNRVLDYLLDPFSFMVNAAGALDDAIMLRVLIT